MLRSNRIRIRLPQRRQRRRSRFNLTSILLQQLISIISQQSMHLPQQLTSLIAQLCQWWKRLVVSNRPGKRRPLIIAIQLQMQPLDFSFHRVALLAEAYLLESARFEALEFLREVRAIVHQLLAARDGGGGDLPETESLGTAECLEEGLRGDCRQGLGV